MDLKAYARDEQRRQQFVKVGYDYIERCRIHFERGDWALFDAASPPDESSEATPQRRARLLHDAFGGSISFITTSSSSKYSRIEQRITYATARSPDLVRELSTFYTASGRMFTVWKEIAAVRRRLVEAYPALQSAVQVRYWRSEYQVLDDLTISPKEFDRLRQLYIDAFETTSRLLIIVCATEGIILRGEIGIPTKKRLMTVDEFDGLRNANKRNIVEPLPIGGVFSGALDADLRNGIGHHSAHYEPDSDEIVLYDVQKGETVMRQMSYTRFVFSVLWLMEVFEFSARYYAWLHVNADGRLQ